MIMVTVTFWTSLRVPASSFVWIICSFGLGFVLLMLDDSLYDMFSYLIYIG